MFVGHRWERLLGPAFISIAILLLVAGLGTSGVVTGGALTLQDSRNTAAASVVEDAFDREVIDGWGEADSGGAYQLTADAAPNYAVTGAEGTIQLDDNQLSLSAVVANVQAGATDHRYRVRIDQAPIGGGINVYQLARIGDDGEQYRARLTFMPDGRLRLGADKLVPEVDGPVVLGDAVTLRNLVYKPDQAVWFRARFEGADSTSIQLKAWTDGDMEPSRWTIDLIDDEEVLQDSGAVGILVTSSRAVTNLPLKLAFDDYSVAPPNRGSATPTADSPAATVPVIAAREHPVVMAAGDIACGADTSPADCVQMGTSDLILKEDPDAVLALGDIQYECGELEDFQNYFEPSWGRLKDRILPAIGNHEYQVSQDETGNCFGVPSGAPGYWTYFGAAATPLDPDCRVDCDGWYSFNMADWHFVALNSNCSQIDGCDADSPQGRWLRDDLNANPTACTLVYWHHPYVSSGNHGSFDQYRAFWEILYEAGVDVVLVGHDHHYERFAPIDPDRAVDPEFGIRQFLVGTGGKNLTGQSDETGLLPTSEVFDDTTFGVLRLRLNPTSYEWTFVPLVEENSVPFTDAGIGACHDAPPNEQERIQRPAAEATPKTTALVFADDFESGTFDAWTNTDGLVVQGEEIVSSDFATRGGGTGTRANVRHALDPLETELVRRRQPKLLGQGDNSVNLNRLGDVKGGSILGIPITSTGSFGARNDRGRTNTTSDMGVMPGVWQELLALLIDLRQPPPLGKGPISRIDQGDSAEGRVFDIAFDDIDQPSHGSAWPTVPVGPASPLAAIDYQHW